MIYILIGILVAIIGNGFIGLGQIFQKYGMNQMAEQDKSNKLPRNKRSTEFTKFNASQDADDKLKKSDSQKSWTIERLNKFLAKSRLGNRYWLGGFIMCYLGELVGNWVGISLASVAMITPLGILSVVINAYFANKWLGEKFGRSQRQAFLYIALGVLLILIAAPKPETSSSGDNAFLPDTKQQWMEIMSSSGFFWTVSPLVILEIAMLHQIFVKNSCSILVYVGSTAALGAITVISSRALILLLRVISLSQSSKTEILSSLNNSTSSSKYHKHIPVDTDVGPAMFVVLVTIFFGSVSQEIAKQAALSKFPTSKFQPLLYAAFNTLSVLGNVIVFREIRGGFLQWTIFLVGFFSGISLVYHGTLKMNPNESNLPDFKAS